MRGRSACWQLYMYKRIHVYLLTCRPAVLIPANLSVYPYRSLYIQYYMYIYELRNLDFEYAKPMPQISCVVAAQMNSDVVFDTHIVQSFFFRGSSPTLIKQCRFLEQGTFTPQKVLVIPRKRWLRPNMTEKLFIGTLRINQPTNQPSSSLIRNSKPKAILRLHSPICGQKNPLFSLFPREKPKLPNLTLK